jgi:glycosyltransferase involved in cell wall biosynthesis
VTPEALAAVSEWTGRSAGILVLIAPEAPVAVAAANSASNDDPRIYVVDERRETLAAIFQELATQGKAGAVTLFHGSIQDFFRDLPLEPSFLCIDAVSDSDGGVDLHLLRESLPANIPLLLLNASAGFEDAVAAELLTAPLVIPAGLVFHTTTKCRGNGFVPDRTARTILQGRLHERYLLSEAASAYTPVADLTVDLRREFACRARVASQSGPWPYAPSSTDLPPTLPDGSPWPKISIVTPSFNQGAYIEETLLSVLHQGYPNVEHIVIDGASTDETPSILARYRDRLAHVFSEPDNGQSHAINKGMAHATGEILTWLNGDDMLAPAALAAVALAFATHPADMIAGICRLYRDGRLEAQHLTSCEDGALPLHDLLDLDHGWNAGQFFYQPEVMFTREIWQRAGGYVNDWLHYSMDYELWLRFAEAGARLHVVGRPIAWFRLHEQQKTHIASRFQAELAVCRRDFLAGRGIPDKPPAPSRKPRNLRITMLNDIGPFYGAGAAHVRMARALAWAGHEISLVSILDRSILGFESTHYTSQQVQEKVGESHPDLVIVGNLHAAGADPFLLHLLSERYPTALVLHDFWSITGRCAYPSGCDKYSTGCDHSCPTPNEYPALPPDQIAGAWRTKRLLLGEPGGPAILANSQWAAGIARDALSVPPGGHSRTPAIATFQLSFPLETFRPRERRLCREAFGLPEDSFVILLASSLNTPRKGGMAFLQALAKIDLPDLLVVVLGEPNSTLELPVPVRQLGHIHDQRRVAMVNAAADLVVAPSMEETFGQTVVEAIACGTPALAYPVTGVCEALRNGVTGMLAKAADPDSLAAAVQFLYARPQTRRNIAAWGRLYVENEWSELAASRRLFHALRAIDTEGRLNLPRNLRFLAAEPPLPDFQVVAQCRESWRPRQGFSPIEQAVPEHRLGPYRWTYGPSALAELFADDTGLHRFLLAYRNPDAPQRLTLRCNGMDSATFDLPRTGYGSGRVLVVNLALEKGSNLVHLEFSCWDRSDLARPRAMIVTDILVEPVAAGDPIARQTTARQMLESVWGASAAELC